LGGGGANGTLLVENLSTSVLFLKKSRVDANFTWFSLLGSFSQTDGATCASFYRDSRTFELLILLEQIRN
jgi:hypothetical protein